LVSVCPVYEIFKIGVDMKLFSKNLCSILTIISVVPSVYSQETAEIAYDGGNPSLTY
jgi:hypothetical protein